MKFVAYLTIYEGDELPPFYIGSTSLKRFNEGYHGTVLSKKYKEIYQKELKEHPELFDSCIIAEFPTRKEATECELYYQKLYDAPRNSKFFNRGWAAPNGHFGTSLAGEDHPLYGSHNCKGSIHSHNPITGESQFKNYIPEGFIMGRSSDYKASSHNKGKRWYNDGVNYKMFHPDEVPEGWVKGKLYSAVQAASNKMWKRRKNENLTSR